MLPKVIQLPRGQNSNLRLPDVRVHSLNLHPRRKWAGGKVTEREGLHEGESGSSLWASPRRSAWRPSASLPPQVKGECGEIHGLTVRK